MGKYDLKPFEIFIVTLPPTDFNSINHKGLVMFGKFKRANNNKHLTVEETNSQHKSEPNEVFLQILITDIVNCRFYPYFWGHPVYTIHVPAIKCENSKDF